MEKLLNILNEYKKTRVKEYWIEFNIWEEKWELHIIIDDWQYNYSWWTCDTDIAISYIISKKFWFISWLVDNDKIDISKTPWHYIYHYTDEDVVKEALMQLAIQYEPIDFLISILK